MTVRHPAAGFSAWLVLALIVLASCTVNSEPLEVGPAPRDAPVPPAFTADAGVEEAASTDAALCIATDCPAPFGTCKTSQFKCDVDFSTDDKNCGGCGIVCPTFPLIRLRARCVDSACQVLCAPGTIDCNGVIDDGCETLLTSDSNNCGSCGVKCPEGTPCAHGKCGCTPPDVYCPPVGPYSGLCTDTSKDPGNCGACRHACDDSARPPPPPKMQYTCKVSTCGRLACALAWADCDGDVAIDPATSNGCETRIDTPENCGACGVKCAPGQRCGELRDKPGLHCLCPPGTSDCGGPDCVDFLSNAHHCGGCGIHCPGEPVVRLTIPGRPPLVIITHAQPQCRGGLCALACDPGWADCDGVPENGCETDVGRDPANCGACGVACDASAGQPCVSGKCVTRSCDEEPGKGATR